jgi:hypothetical protein
LPLRAESKHFLTKLAQKTSEADFLAAFAAPVGAELSFAFVFVLVAFFVDLATFEEVFEVAFDFVDEVLTVCVVLFVVFALVVFADERAFVPRASIGPASATAANTSKSASAEVTKRSSERGVILKGRRVGR